MVLSYSIGSQDKEVDTLYIQLLKILVHVYSNRLSLDKYVLFYECILVSLKKTINSILCSYSSVSKYSSISPISSNFSSLSCSKDIEPP